MMNDPRWWRVGLFTVPASVLATGLSYIIYQLFDGVTSSTILLDGFLTITLAGLFLFGTFVWGWGILVGWLLWPVVWNPLVRNGLREPLAAAFCALCVSVVGGVLPFAALSQPDFSNFAVVFLIPALFSVVLGPVAAYFFFQKTNIVGEL
jgi:hypothetical protein